MSLSKTIKEELSGSVAKSYVAQICRFHRIQGSTMFHDAAEYVKSELLNLGMEDAAIEQYPADGKFKYWTHTSPVGWTVKSAELHVVEPAPERLICSYEDLPHCLHTFSNATRPEGATAELIDVGTGIKPKDYDGKDVKGKIVLATGRAKPVHEQAVFKRGAAGVVTDTITYEMPSVRESLDIPDAHAYQSIWPTAKELPNVTFGFSLSKRQGNQLRALLEDSKSVKLRAIVDAKLFSGYEDVVTATISGASRPEEEIFLIAHLCHPKPSANDNASGAGLLLEIARTIKTLVAKRKIPHPARTIRFFWVPETLGTIAYLAKHEEEARTHLVAGINLDMVGQDQELCRSSLCIDRTPDSLPSYLNDYVCSFMEQSVEEFDKETIFGSSSTFRYRVNAFSGASDHAEFTESTIGVPCVSLGQWPDLYYHTSMDTLDKVSEDSLKRVGWITAMAALSLANANHEDMLYMARITESRGIMRLSQTGTEAIRHVLKKREELKDNRTELTKEIAKVTAYYENKIEHVVWREQQSVKSVKRLGEHPELTVLLDRCCDNVAKQGMWETRELNEALNFVAKTSAITLPNLKETEADKEAKRLVPRKLFKGTLSDDMFKKALSEKEYEWYEKIDEKDAQFDKKMSEILRFMNGVRTAYDITKAVSAEYTPTETENVLKYLRDLGKLGLIAF